MAGGSLMSLTDPLSAPSAPHSSKGGSEPPSDGGSAQASPGDPAPTSPGDPAPTAPGGPAPTSPGGPAPTSPGGSNLSLQGRRHYGRRRGSVPVGDAFVARLGPVTAEPFAAIEDSLGP